MTRPSVVNRLLADKAGLADQLRDPASGPLWHSQHAGMATMSGGNVTPLMTQRLVQKWSRSLAVAEDFAITRDLCAVLTQAAIDLPDDYTVEHHHLYAEHGLLWLEEPLRDEVFSVPIRMLGWHHGTGWSGRKERGPGVVPGLEVNLWAYMQPGVWVAAGSDFLPYGMTSQGWDEVLGIDPGYRLSLATRFVLAAQLFMRQELPVAEAFPYPRSMRPYLRRLDWKGQAVTVIDLRKRKHVPRETEGESGRHYHVRHVVRGHWRSYWVGPAHPLHSGSGDQREKVHMYVHAFLRGPEDGPLAMTERVHIIRR